MKTKITVETIVRAPLDRVWQYWTKPEHIVGWNFASPDWHCPKATNNLVVGGKFNYRMESRDGSSGFDFEGTYTNVLVEKLIEYVLGDERKVKIEFIGQENNVKVVETFDTEDINTLELQKNGWQSILDNFKKLVEQTAA